MGIENPVHLLFIAVIALVVLGPRRLPELARAVGKGVREFREAISTENTAGREQIGASSQPPAAPALGAAPAASLPAAPALAVPPASAETQPAGESPGEAESPPPSPGLGG